MEHVTTRSLRLPVSAGVELEGDLSLPDGARGLVIFAHGSGSSRLSPRNRFVARGLNAKGLGTLLFDLLTPGEAADRANVFDIPLLGGRVETAIRWVQAEAGLRELNIGLFGASTGAAAALTAAAHMPDNVSAVVSRGGRPDLAGDALARVRAPVLLVVGGADYVVIDLNKAAQARLTCISQLEIVPGATHLFEEPGTLEQVIERSSDWFCTHLGCPASAA
ncbi:dienelactone hydrolase family protein [Marimonas lutisalis]|uniref:dienelactone hydrolase family protein n=1 Tax=Marimonas lutisalis TaxID=2545756 RepID=UPI001F30573F|nr:alpha/beta fold hydrolase [Marimonas lutisalis]